MLRHRPRHGADHARRDFLLALSIGAMLGLGFAVMADSLSARRQTARPGTLTAHELTMIEMSGRLLDEERAQWTRR